MRQDQLNSVGLLIARLTLSVVFFAHGTQKVFGWFGGYGFSGTLGFFQSALGVPAPLAFVGVIAEFIACILLLLGASTRFASLLTTGQMLAAIYLLHGKSGFFMNYYQQLPAGQEGFEMNLALIGLSFTLFFAGAGQYALDAKYNLDFIGRWLGLKSTEPAMAH